MSETGDVQTRFDALQAGLAEQWRLISGYSEEAQTMVVVPSLSLDFAGPAALVQAYEERMLFLLLLLRKPRARIVYVTSQPVSADVVDYYLSLLPGVIPSHARARLAMVAVGDGSARPLTQKLLERPRLLQRLQKLAGNPRFAHLIPFNTTVRERDLALALGIPMYASDPRFQSLGTKSGGRRVFRAVGVSCPDGEEDVRTAPEVTAALVRLRARHPGLTEAIVKLDDGASGEGNAMVDLRGCSADAAAVGARVHALRPVGAGLTAGGFLAALAERGGVVEERLSGLRFESPSVQLRISPLGALEVLSTHDQILDGQRYVGCRFPADRAYAGAITRDAMKVGEHLAGQGVLGRFAVDFVVAGDGAGTWTAHAIELNLRKGGTTHPYLTLEFLTGGDYDQDAGVFRTPDGNEKCYVATDRLEAPALRALSPDDLFDFAVQRSLHFDHSTQSGLIFHMLSGVTELGRVGLTAVGNSHAQAQAMYDSAVEGLSALA